jgi:hypothetical protein
MAKDREFPISGSAVTASWSNSFFADHNPPPPSRVRLATLVPQNFRGFLKIERVDVGCAGFRSFGADIHVDRPCIFANRPGLPTILHHAGRVHVEKCHDDGDLCFLNLQNIATLAVFLASATMFLTRDHSSGKGSWLPPPGSPERATEVPPPWKASGLSAKIRTLRSRAVQVWFLRYGVVWMTAFFIYLSTDMFRR